MDEFLAKGWIKPSCSPWGASIIFIWKKTGELRMTVDYHALNRYTKKDVYPLPRIDVFLDKLLYVLKDAATGYLSIQTVCLSCGLISIGHGLSFIYFGRVLKGLLVFGTAERIILSLELFATTIGLVQDN